MGTGGRAHDVLIGGAATSSDPPRQQEGRIAQIAGPERGLQQQALPHFIAQLVLLEFARARPG